MFFLHMHKCAVSVATKQLLVDQLLRLQRSGLTNPNDTMVANSVTLQVCALLQISDLGCGDLGAVGGGYHRMRVVGKQGRYALYTGDNLTAPRFLFMLRLPRVGGQERRAGVATTTPPHCCLGVFFCSTSDSSSANSSANSSAGIADTLNTTTAKPLGCGATELLRLTHDTATHNAVIIRAMQPFMRANHSVVDRGDQDGLVVHVAQCDGSNSYVPILEIGLKAARDALRRKAGVYASIVIAQTTEYTISMELRSGLFKLRLDRTDDLFESERGCSGDDGRSSALTSLSHQFHWLDSVVEETHTARRRVVSSSLHKTAQNCRQRVSGMLPVVQAILRDNVAAVRIRSMGCNPAVSTYAGMHLADIALVLRTLCLVTDNCKLAGAINGVYRGIVVTHITDTALVSGATLPRTGCNLVQQPSAGHLAAVLKTDHRYCDDYDYDYDCNNTLVDFRVLHSGALRYATAHQNTRISALLMNSLGLDIQATSTALYSGIAYCHSCAYDTPPVQVTPGVWTHLINASDFPVHLRNTVDCVLVTAAKELISCGSPVPWSTLRHNFRVPNGHVTAVGVECHVTKSGFVFFRCAKDAPPCVGAVCSGSGSGSGSSKHGEFVGAVYIAPSFVRALFVADGGDSSSSSSSAVAAPASLCEASSSTAAAARPSWRTRRPTHPLVDVVTRLAAEAPASKDLLLRNATETIFHINAMCVHNDVCQLQRPNKELSTAAASRLNEKHHAMLRTVWLHTNMVKASRVCAGVQNAEFCRIYAYLSNLAQLPLNDVSYWATMPFV